MPRKLPNTAIEQYAATLAEFERVVEEYAHALVFSQPCFDHRSGEYVDPDDFEININQLRHKLITMFAKRGT